jgi:DNA ligase-1
VTPTITAPMKATAVKDVKKLVYPLWAQPKIDGIRCLKINGRLLTASFKPIPNRHINEVLTSLIPNGFDGELVLADGRPFNEISSAVMSKAGEPDFLYMVFDYVARKTNRPYWEREVDLRGYINQLISSETEIVRRVLAAVIRDSEELLQYEKFCLSRGYEGVMLRCPVGPYKSGRSTLKEQYLLKLKRFEDAEAKIVGWEEQFTNLNESKRDELGRAKRSSKISGKVATNTLGAFIVRDRKNWKKDFAVGTGISDTLRRDVWRCRHDYKGRLIKYKFQRHGSKDAPRHPVFIGFRSKLDVTK